MNPRPSRRSGFGPIPITEGGMVALKRARLTPSSTGQWPDLDDLAAKFGMPRAQMNLAIDALQGRTPEAAHASLVARFGAPTMDDLQGGGHVGATLRRFLSRLGWEV